MSETPRLTRRQLREMGKLVAKPEDAPALTDTQELRLRRPSRKELREAERVERERNEALILQGAAEKEARENGGIAAGTGKSDEKPERKSVFDRFESEFDSETDKDTGADTAAGNSGLRFSYSKHSDLKQPENIAAADSAVRDTGNHLASAANPHSHSARQSETDISAKSGEANSNLHAINESSAEALEQGSLREQLFARMRYSEKRDSAAGALGQSTVETDSAALQADTNKEITAAANLSAGTANHAAEEFSANSADIAEKNISNKSAEAESNLISRTAGTLHAEDFPQTAPQTEAALEAEIVNDTKVAETEVNAERAGNSKRSWFIFLILAIIFALIGYLIGSWLNSTFFAAGIDSVHFAIASSVILY